MNPDMKKPWIRKQIEWIASLPSSQEAKAAVELLSLDSFRPVPDLLLLMEWAAEEMVGLGLDDSSVVERLEMMRDQIWEGRWDMAITDLLNLDNVEEEIRPELLEIKTPQEIARAMQRITL